VIVQGLLVGIAIEAFAIIFVLGRIYVRNWRPDLRRASSSQRLLFLAVMTVLSIGAGFLFVAAYR
jgi:hypothetical protein